MNTHANPVHIEEQPKTGLRTVWRVLVFTFALIRLPIFLVMLWMRGIIVGLCSTLSIATLFCWLFCWWAYPDNKQLVWGFGIGSFGLFVLGFAYDYILLMIEPRDLTMIL